MVILSLVLAISAAVTPPSPRAINELASDGEVLLLPRHNRQPFEGWLFTRSTDTCDVIEARMLDVPNWPKYFSNIDEAKATRVGDVITYELDLKVALAPAIPGRIRRISARELRFEDGETKAYSVYHLEDAGSGCLVRYQIVEERGKSSGWVAVIKNLEASSGDAGNFAAGISSARGFAKGEKGPPTARSGASQEARQLLSGQGTMVEINRRGPRATYTLRRRVTAPFSDVAWAIRNKKGYAEKTSVVKSSEDHGTSADYTIGGFGGRVSFTNSVKETTTNGVLVIEERPSGGDLGPGNGLWRWTLSPVEGGVDVELFFSADIIAGSRLMSMMARQDPIARESFMLHVAMAFMGDIIGGNSLSASVMHIARESSPHSATK